MFNKGSSAPSRINVGSFAVQEFVLNILIVVKGIKGPQARQEAIEVVAQGKGIHAFVNVIASVFFGGAILNENQREKSFKM
jgi:hypothetical protein